MPKKRQKAAFTNPTASRLAFDSSGPEDRQNARSSASHASSSTADQPSVNDLINHLRRTQVSSKGGAADQSKPVTPRSVHPALRNVLEVPETPPPRPRPNTQRTGVGGPRLRRTPGPPPPKSWLVGDSASGYGYDSDKGRQAAGACAERKTIYRLERLPGATFPAKDRLLHLALKSMALNWMWHVEYDGEFLGLLPSHIKVLLLSYIAVHARNLPLGQLMQGVKPLYQKPAANDSDDGDDFYQDTDSDTTRLDLGGALGRWMTIKQLTKELAPSQKPDTESAVGKGKDAVPSSWEDDYADEPDSIQGAQSIPKSPSKGLRFENLRFLSLAHPNPSAANWKSLINLLSRLSTLTHLSLAHWPVPTLTPNAMNARIQHPTQSSLSFSYSGTDSYASFENNWAEAAGVLRKLSRVTYCLKWLDLEGCEDWIPALKWEDTGDDGEVHAPGSTGPEWNQSWRNIEYVRLGPGWLPRFDVAELPSHRQAETERIVPGSSSLSSPRLSPSRSLASSMHAPFWRPAGGEKPQSPTQDLPWDVEEERIKYRQSKELERFRESVRCAKAVQNHVLHIRRQGRGKWVHFSFGLEDLGFDDLRSLLGQDYLNVVP
jgi:hypothetical protein